MNMRVPEREPVLLKISHQCFWDLLSILRKDLYCIISKNLLDLFLLLLSYEEVGGTVVRTSKNGESREKTKRFPQRVARAKSVPRITTTQPLSHNQNSDCKSFWKLRWK